MRGVYAVAAEIASDKTQAMSRAAAEALKPRNQAAAIIPAG
jgi:hypothetical protein